MRKQISCGILAVWMALVMLLTGCQRGGSAAASTAETIATLDAFTGTRIGVIQGTIHDQLAAERWPDAQVLYYNSIADLTMALESGKIDGFVSVEPAVRCLMNQNSAVAMVPERINSADYAYVFPKTQKGARLQGQMNEFLAKLRADGTLDEIRDIWTGTDEAKKVVDYPAEGPALNMAVASNDEPFVYVKDNVLVGYDLDVAARFCTEYGYTLEPEDMNFSAIVAGVGVGKYDLGADGIAITEERKESVLFSDANYDGGNVLAVLKDSGGAEGTGFWEGLKASFNRTFITENRWKLIVNGLGVTALISVLFAVFGTLLGFGLCLLRRGKNRIVRALVDGFNKLIQGLPMVVFLLILNYVVFVKTGLSGVAVSVIGFSIVFGCAVCGMLTVGLDGVDKGELEAAAALGYTPRQVFAKVGLPQAVRQVLPLYKGEFVSCVKLTSIVGYIAVQDLTKAGDIIRSRTLEAFFPLIVTAVLYFLISNLLVLALTRVEMRLDPKRRKREVKGVKMV